ALAERSECVGEAHAARLLVGTEGFPAAGLKSRPVGFADVWSRTLVYFGIAEEDEEWDEEGYLANEELERTYAERPNVRRLAPRRRRDFDDWTDPDPEPDDDRTAVIRPAARLRGVESVPASVRVHLVLPRSFNDAQQ